MILLAKSIQSLLAHKKNVNVALADVYQRKIQFIVELLQQETLSLEKIQFTGEEISNLLGRILKFKVCLENIIRRLKALL